MKIDWERKNGEESSQGSLDPSRPALAIPESRQAGPESDSDIDNAGVNVNPQNKELLFRH